jgi:DNA-binding response OmpR family regulator
MARKHRVLIIEDDPGTLNLLNHIVIRAGYEPILARGGQEGLQLLQDAGADLVLLDIMMKGMDGWTVLETIKADSHLGNVPVIMVSAKTPSEHPSLMETYADMYEDYFLKPFNVNELVAKLAEILPTGRAD